MFGIGKPKCNHAIGIYRPKFGEEKPVYHNDFIKNSKKWRGELYWRCPLCRIQIWKWVTKRDEEGLKYKMRRYIGNGAKIDF